MHVFMFDQYFIFMKVHCLPAFDYLSKLKLIINDCYYWDLLTELLKRSPRLEFLVVEHDDVSCISPHVSHTIVHLFTVFISFTLFRSQIVLPIMMSMSTYKMSYTQISDGVHRSLCLLVWYPNERKVAKYLLQSGKILKKVTIHDEVFRDLMLQKDSRKWQVKFCKSSLYSVRQ